MFWNNVIITAPALFTRGYNRSHVYSPQRPRHVKLWWFQKSNFFIQENAFENVVCEMAAILSRGRRIKNALPSWLCNAMLGSSFCQMILLSLYGIV